jgi:glycosyltransferase involved in cell wall biosynthesis
METGKAVKPLTTSFITVLITTYNYGRFIEQAIDSVLSQTHPPDKIQLLLVDDGSTDDTSARISKYGSRLEYFQKANGGQASALNFGFAHARGEIVCLLDADDTFVPEKLARVAEAFERDPSLGLVYHRAKEWNVETGQYTGDDFIPVSGDVHKEPGRFAFYTPQVTTCVCFRRSVVTDLLPIPDRIRMNADCFLVALIPFLAPVLALPEFLSIYRIHGKNSFYLGDRLIPGEERQRRLLVWQTVIDEMRAWLAAHNYSEDFPPARALMNQWNALIDREAIAVTPPGRFPYFRHLLRSYRYRLPLMNWRLRLINYLDAFAALIVGYHRFPLWRKWRESQLLRLRSLRRKPSPPL